MVEPAETRERNQPCVVGWVRLDGPVGRCVLLEGVVGPVVVVVVGLLSEDTAKVVFTEDNHVVETVLSEISIPSFSSSPWKSGAPQSGAASAIWRMSARISGLTGGRPEPRFLDFHRQ